MPLSVLPPCLLGLCIVTQANTQGLLPGQLSRAGPCALQYAKAKAKAELAEKAKRKEQERLARWQARASNGGMSNRQRKAQRRREAKVIIRTLRTPCLAHVHIKAVLKHQASDVVLMQVCGCTNTELTLSPAGSCILSWTVSTMPVHSLALTASAAAKVT